jgi:ribosomal protein L30E
MARRAGKITLGFDASKETITEKTSELILITSDVSEKTAKEISFFAAKENVKVAKIDLTTDDTTRLFGKSYGVMSLTDGGFANAILTADEKPNVRRNRI